MDTNKWRVKNKEKVKEITKSYVEKNREKVNQYKKVWSEKNREKIREQKRKWREKNKEKIKEKRKIYKAENKEKISKTNKIYNDKTKDYRKDYYLKNKEKIINYQKEYKKKRKSTDPLFKLKNDFSKLLLMSFKRKGYGKKTKTQQILGCTFEEFKQHLEKQFEPWMNWENKGLYNGTPNFGWDIDHVIPQSSAKTEDELIKLNHYTNLKPLCSYINRDVKRSIV